MFPDLVPIAGMVTGLLITGMVRTAIILELNFLYHSMLRPPILPPYRPTALPPDT